MSRKSRRKKRKQLVDFDQFAAEETAVAAEGSQSSIQLIAYGPAGLEEKPYKNAAETRALTGKWPVLWVNVDGIGDGSIIQEMGNIFKLHELPLEDVAHIQQRAKVEEYDGTLFVVLRMPLSKVDHVAMEQLSIFVGKGFVVTFQEKSGGDVLEPLRVRIRKGQGRIREEQSDYLLYAIIDSVIDGYFPLVELISDELERIEDDVLAGADRNAPVHMLDIKHDVLAVRRAIWPARDAVTALTHEGAFNLVSQKTSVYMRDCYDHVIRVIDLVEAQREMCSDLMDLYHSTVSNRMNEVIKVLTTITLLFMPPTLIAGIYGMNFDTKISHLNMPELTWPFGYMFAIGLMLVSAIGVWSYGRHHGWLAADADELSKTAEAQPAH
jgi:magnesium transporter